tara:strand:- start:34 stop:612 length:579 start_codon:yes stop_codon:yes gene_type:complete
MPPRKKVKGKKPEETMRQRQRRLLREQRQRAASNRVKQRALPPAGESGGSKPPKGTKKPGTTRNTGPGRRPTAASKKAGASMGSRGTGVRIGTPAKVGAGRGALSILKKFGPAGAAIAAGAAIGSAMKRYLPKNTGGSGRGSGARAFEGGTNTPKPRKKEKMGPPAPVYRKSNYKTAEQFMNDPKYKKKKKK